MPAVVMLLSLLLRAVSGSSGLATVLAAAPLAFCPRDVFGQSRAVNGPGCRSGKRSIVQTEMAGSSFSSFLPIQHDGGGATTEMSFARLQRMAGPIASERRARRFSLGAHCKQPACLRPQARTGHGCSQLPRPVTGKLQNGSGAYPGVFGQGPVAASSGIECQVVDVTSRPLRVTDCATQGRERDSTDGSRS
jgi:hypothetical protein